MTQNENQKPKSSFRELTQKIHQALLDVPSEEKELSQEGKALASLFVCLVHSLHDSNLLDSEALLDNLHQSTQSFINDGDAIAAKHVNSLYVQMLVQLQS